VTLTQCIRGGKDGRAGYIIAFSYDEQTVEELKRAVPHTHREWKPDEKTWWVSIEFEPQLSRLFKNFEALAHSQGQMF